MAVNFTNDPLRPKVAEPVIETDKSISLISDDDKTSGASYDMFNMIMNQIRDARNNAQNRASLSAKDLYGEEITRATDAIKSNANNTKMVLGRANAAKGGDITGSRGIRFDNIDQKANKSEQNINLMYANKAESANNRSRARADNLLNMILNAEGSKLGIMNNNYWRNKELDLQRQQANRQLIVDIIGTAGNIGTEL